MSSKAKKGGSFEREIADKLSLWWTQDETPPRTDIFWRSSNSGGRATVRKKKGQGTAGQYGDMAATDPIGMPFLEVVTTELKRGYSGSTIAELLDIHVNAAQQVYEEWLEKVITNQKHAGSFAWMLLVKRDRKEALVYIPNKLWATLRAVGAMKNLPCPFFSITTKIRFKNSEVKECDETIIGMHLEAFLKGTKPNHILAIAGKHKEEENNETTKALSKL